MTAPGRGPGRAAEGSGGGGSPRPDAEGLPPAPHPTGTAALGELRDHAAVRYLPPWRIELTTRPGVPRLLSIDALARLCVAALESARAPGPASIGVILSDDRELAALNLRAMGRRGPTDVLSFPLLPPAAFPPHPGQAPGASGPSTAFALPPGTRPHLGDVIVSVGRAVAQAREGRGGQTGDVAWAPADELALLVVHGVLHVCGWDHADAEEEAAMRALERRILAVAGRPDAGRPDASRSSRPPAARRARPR